MKKTNKKTEKKKLPTAVVTREDKFVVSNLREIPKCLEWTICDHRHIILPNVSGFIKRMKVCIHVIKWALA